MNRTSLDDGLIEVKFRNHSTVNYSLFYQKISSFDWSAIHSTNSSVYMQNFITGLNSIYCTSFPLKSKTISRKRLSKPWLTRDLFAQV